jgi:hypothetical protein
MTSKILASSLLLLSMAGCGQTVSTPPASTDDSQARIAACTTLYDSYVTWAKACTGVEPARAEIEDLAGACAQRAALPGIELPATAILSCGEKVLAASCAALPLECLTPLPGYEGSPGAWLTDVVSNFVEGGAIFELFPRTKGTLALGQACDLSAQCGSGTCGPGQGCGACVDMKDPGEACGATAICRSGSQCQGGVCVDGRPSLGETCSLGKSLGNVCQADLYCTDVVCAKRLAVGEACKGFDSSECVPGAICDASICQTLTVGHAGDACDDVAARCVEGTFCQDGICHVPVANVPLYGKCGIDVCAPGLNCYYGQCQPPSEAGAYCLAWEDCGGGAYCQRGTNDSGFCAAPLREGEACSYLPGCELGLFCDATTHRCRRDIEEGAACSDTVACRWPFRCLDGICGDILCSAP